MLATAVSKRMSASPSAAIASASARVPARSLYVAQASNMIGQLPLASEHQRIACV